MACAVIRRRFSSGCKSHPANAPAGSTGAVMEVTKWLKPSGKRVTKYGDSASVQAVTRVNAEQASKRTMRRPTRLPYRGRLIRLGEVSKARRSAAAPGYWRQHVHKESARNTGSPKAWAAMPNRTPARDRPGALGVAERFVVPLKRGNAGGGKGPQFKTNAISGEGPGDWATYQLRKLFRSLQMALHAKA